MHNAIHSPKAKPAKGPLVLDKPHQIAAFRLLALRAALSIKVTTGFSIARNFHPSMIRDILLKAGKEAPRQLAKLDEAYAAYLVEIGILVPTALRSDDSN